MTFSTSASKAPTLSTWTCGTLVEEVSLPDTSGLETVTVRQSVPAGSQARSYLRLRIEKR